MRFANWALRTAAAGEKLSYDLGEVAVIKAGDNRKRSVEFLDHAPFHAPGCGKRHLLAAQALVWQPSQMLSMMEKHHHVEWSSNHQNLAPGFNQLGNRRSLPMALVEGIVGGEPVGLGAYGGDRRTRIAATPCVRRRADELSEHTIVADGAG